MLPEVFIKSALEAVVGYGFKSVIERVMVASGGKSDREILEAILWELQRQGVQLGDLNFRLAQLETEIQRLQAAPAPHLELRTSDNSWSLPDYSYSGEDRYQDAYLPYADPYSQLLSVVRVFGTTGWVN